MLVMKQPTASLQVFQVQVPRGTVHAVPDEPASHHRHRGERMRGTGPSHEDIMNAAAEPNNRLECSGRCKETAHDAPIFMDRLG